ncbi:P-loop NTPase [Parasphingopyxis lamellibrachiae]|uniref:Exopolysaccharide/PEP-CTERM locus tyrosine autokinase n=1 Tax=Parasphingopyxis lamellibrachiae TaxID=680125 RepID=A0A3D9FD06_9SPHN|nr:P-loop NTPase [Parasphingopyxis lamellibrachiae]RED15669.1 exopolysaccharide/PEP-CTERM locus tyrosine autokinase [Parasphingopyxis lamellibrachiae]
MNKYSSIGSSGSLLERAAEKFDFAAALRGAATEFPEAEAVPAPDNSQPVRDTDTPKAPIVRGETVAVDRVALAEAGFILPDQRPGPLAEEFRIVKRQLLLRAAGEGGTPLKNGRMILVCSANPDEGKTFCSVNLALSMSRETDLDIVLVDSDLNNPEIAKLMGIGDGPGLIDALSDPAIDIESCVTPTDIPNLSILRSGRRTDDATELLASQRTSAKIEGLLSHSPTRIVIFDSPPALSASPASVLAMLAGQTVMVVKADTTSEAELREALGLLDGCDDIQLLLNGVTFTPNGKRFSTYYGYGE